MKKAFLFLIFINFVFFCLKSGAQPAPKKGFGFSFMANGKDSVFITKVFANGPAQKAGLRDNDEILQVDNVSLQGKNGKEVGEIFASKENGALFKISRKGNAMKFTVTKAFQYTYDKTCVAGNCINGYGTALSNIMPGVLYKGKFESGELVEGKWCLNAKNANDTGYWAQKGKITEGRYFTGVFYDSKMPDGGYIYEVTNYDLNKGPLSKKLFDGEVRCYTNNHTERYLWVGEFTDGSPNGFFTEYLYNKELMWRYIARGNSYKSQHKLKRIDGNNVVGDWLASDGVKYEEAAKTWSWNFFYDPYFKGNVAKLENVSSYQDYLAKIEAKNAQTNGPAGKAKPAGNRPVCESMPGGCEARKLIGGQLDKAHSLTDGTEKLSNIYDNAFLNGMSKQDQKKLLQKIVDENSAAIKICDQVLVQYSNLLIPAEKSYEESIRKLANIFLKKFNKELEQFK